MNETVKSILRGANAPDRSRGYIQASRSADLGLQVVANETLILAWGRDQDPETRANVEDALDELLLRGSTKIDRENNNVTGYTLTSTGYQVAKLL